MKSRVLSIALILLGALLSGKVASAQNITAYDSFSPFTMFGLGHIDRVGDQNSLAMGGVGIGNRDVTVINLQNPAAVTARENQAFMLDFGL
ncbi:MAG: hypothetical protein HUJ90_03250, partial [Bacteroidales bacterium]|nr:hypothetical protein [Bacteroidales bacterium]